MKPEELANNLEARARWAYQQTRASFALEGYESYDVWGEIDRLRAEVADQRMVIAHQRDMRHAEKARAEKAEAEADRLRAELADQAAVIQTLNSSCGNWKRSWVTVNARAELAEARLAAVIALCDIRDRNRRIGAEPTGLTVAQVRAAATEDTK